MMGKTKQELRRPRKLPWPPRLPLLESSDHCSPALRWSLFIFNMELRKIGLEICGLWAATMPPKKSTRQNSVINSHVEAESHDHSHSMGETHALGGGHIPRGENPFGDGHVLGGGEIPIDGPQQMALMFEMIKGMQQTQAELAESLKQLKEVNSNKEDYQNKNDNRNHEERESHNRNYAPFVTMSDVADLLKKGSAIEHISKFLDSMGPFAAHGELCLWEFSKSLVDRAYTWYTVLSAGSIRTWEDMVESFCRKYFHAKEKITLVNLHDTKQLIGEDLVKYIHRFHDVSLDCHVKYQDGELVEVCIDNMLPEFRAHLENLDITQFAHLLQKARKTAVSVKPQVEKGRDKKGPPQALTVSTAATASGNKQKNSIEKSPSNLTAEEKKDPKYCRYRRYVHHPTVDCRTLRWEVNQALITIAAEFGATCFMAKAHASRAFLETTNAITFTDEDMEVQYPDHRRPLYLSVVVKDVQVRCALVDTGSCLNLIPLNTFQATNVSQQKIQGSLMEVIGFRGVTEYTMGHVQFVLRCIKGRLNGKPIRIAANSSPFDQTEAHFVEAALYDELSSTGDPPIVKPCGTPLPDWEDIKDVPETGNSEEVVMNQAKSTAMRTEKSTTVEPKMTAKEELEVINLSDNPDVSKPVSISMSLSAEERKCLIDLLHEYKNVFAWDYDEMLRIDPGLMAHSLNVELSTRPVVQPMRTFHI
uniref:Retrotransposon gag domain-containing protein n=1 Tax=Fagus sylvatica TaxID=28930 RepID=A0A2N9IKE7_FAGSY